jgi:hypothetical protein
MLTESEARDLARRLLDFAGAGPVGRSQDDPVYKQVTEGRELAGQHFGTSCGELPHWLLYRLGVRSAFINRNEAHGWRPGVNIWNLAGLPLARECQPHDRYLCGDIVFIWEKHDTTDAHAMCVIEHTLPDQVLLVAEYGQPGGKLATHQLRPNVDMASGHPRPALFCGGRALQRWVPLMSVLQYAADHGELALPDLHCLDPRDTDQSELAPESEGSPRT